ATLRAPELVQYIIPLLSHSSTRHLAIEALAGYEEKVIEPLLKPYLTSEEASLHIPKIFEQIGTQRAFDVLLQSYKLVSGDVRTSMLESMTRMHDNGRYATSSVVEKLISEEARVIEQLIESSAGLESVPELFEISDAVKQLRRTIARRVFGLLALLYDSKVIHAVHTNWADGDVRRQANAAEVIDQLLHGEIRSTISRLMAHTESPRAEKLTDQRVIENRLLALQLIDHGDAWLSTCLKAAINELPVKKEGALSRETDHARNEHLRINKLLEQVQLLRELTLFKGMSGKDLAKIAESLHEVSFMEGESIIREGEQGDSLYLIQQGTAGVIRNEMKIGHLEEGECFGEMSVLTSGLRTATVRAESYIQLWRLDSSELYEMMFNQNEIALEIMRLLSKRLRGAILRSIQDRTGAGHVNLVAEDTTDIKQLSQVPAQVAAAANQELDQGRQPFTDNEMILRRILVLQKISLFANFSPEDFVKLAKMVDEVRYEQGERICSLGENGDIMHGIIEGSVRVHRDSETIAVLEEGECFGEMAIIDNEPRSADCTAASTSVLLQLSREQVLTFCFGRIDVMKGMLRILAERLKGMQEKG
ncbi:MAG: hypothetical protein K0R67_2451, partial [Paenibacillus sp.]|nr:hypothetical protein [Paenibacillus sp.]